MWSDIDGVLRCTGCGEEVKRHIKEEENAAD